MCRSLGKGRAQRLRVREAEGAGGRRRKVPASSKIKADLQGATGSTHPGPTGATSG